MQSGVKTQGPQGYGNSVQPPCSFADRVSVLTGLQWGWGIPGAYCIKLTTGLFNSLIDPSVCFVFSFTLYFFVALFFFFLGEIF